MKKLPSLLYLEQLQNNLERINNGRFHHQKENCRQSLGFFIRFIKDHKPLDDKLVNHLNETIDKSKKIIKLYFSH